MQMYAMLSNYYQSVYDKFVAQAPGTTKNMSGQLKWQTVVAQGQLADSYPTYQREFSFLSKHASLLLLVLISSAL